MASGMQSLVDVAFNGGHHPGADPNCKRCVDYVPGKGWIATGVDINCGGQVELCPCVNVEKAKKTSRVYGVLRGVRRSLIERKPL